MKLSCSNAEAFLNNALDELKSTDTQLGDDFYQLEIQLVLAAVHWRKSELLSARAAAMTAGEPRDLMEKFAARNRAAAERAIRAFRTTFDHWNVDRAATAVPFKNTADGAYWVDTMYELWKIPV